MSVTRTLYSIEGFARHIQFLTQDQQIYASKLAWISLGVAIAAHSTGRISVALLIYRIQGPCTWRSRLLIFIIGSVALTATGAFLFDFLQCSPPRALWDKYLVEKGNAHCPNDFFVGSFFQGFASYWCAMDFVLAGLPVTILWNLQMPRRKKIIIGSLLGLGVFAGICAAIKVSTLSTLKTDKDTTWIEDVLFIWDTNEINVIIVAACTATLLPLFRAIRTGGFHRKISVAVAGREADELTLRAVAIREARPSMSTQNTAGESDQQHPEVARLWSMGHNASSRNTRGSHPPDSILKQIRMDVSFEAADRSDEVIPNESVLYARNMV